MKKYNFIFLSFLFFIGFFFLLIQNKFFDGEKPSRSFLTIEGTFLSVQIADEPKEMELGLGKRSMLAENEGMLFLFDTYSYPLFWMKDMQFPIDIIWIRDDMIVGFLENVPAFSNENELPRYTPPLPINRVLEVRAGFVKKHHLASQMKVFYNFVD